MDGKRGQAHRTERMYVGTYLVDSRCGRSFLTLGPRPVLFLSGKNL